MHDNMTRAFLIKLPIKTKRFPYGIDILSIWHVDPENFSFKDGSPKLGGSDDDSCGWSRPVYSEKQRDEMISLAKSMYSDVAPFTYALEKGDANQYTSPNPSRFEAVYWCWRAIKHHGKSGWRFGRKVTVNDYNHVMELASAPGDNIGWVFAGVKDERTFVDFFMLVWKNYLRKNRPWYKHPRWHVHHWSITFNIWRDFHARYLRKCECCGERGSRCWFGVYRDGKRITICNSCEGGAIASNPA